MVVQPIPADRQIGFVDVKAIGGLDLNVVRLAAPCAHPK
jgi:hypothetical protein